MTDVAKAGESPSGRRLDSWKEIAAHLGRDPRTVQRWERRDKLPVHRLHHSKLGSVYAYTTELDAWRESRDSARSKDASQATTATSPDHQHASVAVAAAVAGLAIAISLGGIWIGREVGGTRSRIGTGLVPAQDLRVQAPRNGGADVYDRYLKGLFHLNHIPQRIDAGVHELEAVVAGDPAFAPAYVGLAVAYHALGSTSVGALPVIEARAKAITAAERALDIDPRLARAHTIVARGHQQEFRWSDAEAAYRRALEIDPDDPSVHEGYGELLTWRGRTEEGVAYARRARDLDPLSMMRTVRLGWLLYHARRYDDAIRELRTVLAAEQNHPTALWFLSFVLIESSRLDEAIQTLERLTAMRNRNPADLGVLARAYGRAGRRTEALRIVDELNRRDDLGYVPPAPFVHAYIGLGDHDRAFAALERAYRERSNIMQLLKTHPLYDPLRSDPRFVDLLRRSRLQ